MKNITVIGATGMIGIPVTKELVKAGYNVTALVRNPDKASAIFTEGVKFVKGDLDNINSIEEAIKGANGVYINISTRPENKENEFNPENQGLDNVITVIKKVGNIDQLILLSSFLARNYKGDWWVFNAKKSSIDRVKHSGIPYTIFFPSNFMENFNSEGMKRGNKLTVIKGKVENKAFWIAGEDFGKTVAAAFSSKKAINQSYAVQGPEALTMKEAADEFVKSYSKEKLAVSTMPIGLMKFLSVFIYPLKFVSKLMEVMLNNVEVFESEATWNDLVKAEITVKQYAEKMSNK